MSFEISKTGDDRRHEVGELRSAGSWQTPPEAAEVVELDWSIGRLLSALWNHWRFVALSVATFLLLGLVYLLFATRLYSASATLEVNGYMPVLPGAQVESAFQVESKDQDYLKTQVAKLERLAVANEVIKNANLEGTLTEYFDDQSGILSKIIGGIADIFRSGDKKFGDANYSYPKEFLQQYIQLLSVVPVYGTSLIEVGFESADPILSRDLANAHVEGFIQHLRAERTRNLLAKMEFLRTEGESLKKKVTAAEEALAKYAEANELIPLSKNEDVVVREISELTKLLSEATSRRISSQSTLAELEGRDVAETESLDTVAIRRLVVELNQVEADYADLGRKVTPLYPRMQQLNARIQTLKSSIESQRYQRLASLKAKYDGDLQAEKNLSAQIDSKKRLAHQVSRDQVQYNILKREYESLKDLHQSVIRQLKESQLSSASQGTTVSVAEYAALPHKPSAPRKGLVLVFSICAGLGIGTALALFMELFRTTITNAEDGEKSLKIRAIATIPSFVPLLAGDMGAAAPLTGLPEPTSLPPQGDHQKQDVTPNLKKTLVQASGSVTQSIVSSIRKSPRQPLAFQAALEAFRTLRTVLLLSSDDVGARCVMVTSSIKGEGKTTVTTNLAMSLAQSAQSVLLIDCDIRRPNVHRRFGIPSSQIGLIDVLSGECSLQDATVKHSANLHILSAGSIAAHSAELFASSRMRKLLATAKEQYDCVLIDAPPLLPVADSLVLAPLMDAVLLVVRSEETKRHLAVEALRKLRAVRASVLGMILNDYRGMGDRQNTFQHTYDSDYYIVPDDGNDGRKRIAL